MPKNKEEWDKLGNRIRQARKYRGYSQEDIASLLDISRSSISLMENGERKLDSMELKKLAEFFNVSVDDLIGESQTNIDYGEDIEMVARAAEDLTPDDREEVLRFAQFLRSRNRGSEEDE